MDPRTSLAIWLRTGRAERNMSLDDVARVTKIQTRILERLEAGKHEGLPAEVFVRGFVRSVARCLGLDEDEALERWGACAQLAPPPVATPIGPAARGVVEAMSDLAPNTARSPRILRTGEMPVYVPPPSEVDPVETMLLPVTGTLVVHTPPPAPSDVIEKLEVAPAGSLEIPVITTGPVEAEAIPVETRVAEGTEAVEAEAAPVVIEAPKKKRGKGTGKGRGKRKSMATGTPSEPAPVIAAPPADIALEAPLAPVDEAPAVAVAVEAAPSEPVEAAPSEPVVEVAPSEAGSQEIAPAVVEVSVETPVEAIEAAPEAPAATPVDVTQAAAPEPEEDPFIAAAIQAAEARHAVVETEPTTDVCWTPKMPPLATVSQPWRISRPTASALPLTPSLVIDDADPESAAREVEEREASQDPAPRRSFLPPILLDREDRSARQGGLTLAVIILLIAATLTLSYLMRRPSSSGDGVTQLEVPASFIG